MIDKFLNIMRVQAGISQNGVASTALGQIVNYDPDSFSAQVQLYEGDPTDPASEPLTTGWLPIVVPALGWYPAPNLNDLVLVHFQEANQQAGFISLCAYTGNPSQSVPAGEWWFFRADGSYIKFTNDDKISIHSTVEIDISAPTVNITATNANVTATSVALSGSIKMGDLLSSLTPFLNGIARTVYNGHTHSDPQGGTTGIPDQQMDSTTETTNTVGN